MKRNVASTTVRRHSDVICLLGCTYAGTRAGTLTMFQKKTRKGIVPISMLVAPSI